MYLRCLCGEDRTCCCCRYVLQAEFVFSDAVNWYQSVTLLLLMLLLVRLSIFSANELISLCDVPLVILFVPKIN